MYRLAAKVDVLLEQVKDWPLCLALDYLIENGVALLEGWHPLQRKRMAALRWRLATVFRRAGMGSLFQWYLCKGLDGASLFWCKEGASVWPRWNLCCRSGGPQPFWSWIWGGEDRLWIPLGEVVHAERGEFSEEWLCEVAILLWFADRCYHRK